MNHQEILNTLNPIHIGLANSVSSSPIGNNNETPTILYDAIKLEEGRKFTFDFEWYKLLSAYNYSVKELGKYQIIDNLLKFADSYSQSSQFPPDLVKCMRIFKLLEIFKPSHIVELGSGTSTLVISSYLSYRNKENNSHDVKSITVERSQKWLDTTMKKLNSILIDIPDNHYQYSHVTDQETISALRDFSENSGALYIYLDSVILDNEKNQGLDLVENILSKFNGTVMIHIDVRSRAVKELGPMLNRLNLSGTFYTNLIHPRYSRDIRDNIQMVKRCFARFFWGSMAIYTVAVINTSD